MKQFFCSLGAGIVTATIVMFSPDPVPVATGIIVLHVTWMHYEK